MTQSIDTTLPWHRPPESAPLADRRLLLVSGLAIVIALGAGVLADALMALIGLITNLSFYGRWSLAFTSPAGNTLGP